MQIDHVVLWVRDQKSALAFYVDLLGLSPERVEEFQAGEVSFPSVRLTANTIIDLMDRAKVPDVREFTGGPEDSGGTPVNHVCFSMSGNDYAALMSRLKDHGVGTKSGGAGAFGAQGAASESVYFCDPDGNVLEIRHYDQEA